MNLKWRPGTSILIIWWAKVVLVLFSRGGLMTHQQLPTLVRACWLLWRGLTKKVSWITSNGWWVSLVSIIGLHALSQCVVDLFFSILNVAFVDISWQWFTYENLIYVQFLKEEIKCWFTSCQRGHCSNSWNNLDGDLAP